jgi:type II secretory pathway predicted ATPase ExeA/cell division septation protein DedD
VSVNYLKLTTSPSPDTLTYEPFFGLTEKPFSLNADPRFVYDSPTYLATKEGLQNGIRRREGLLVLTGEIGSGKTTLCRAVLRSLGRNTYSSLVPDPFASREDLLKMLLIDFGALSIQELTTGSLRQASRTELGYLLSEFLDSLAADAFVVVIIDEAQNLSLPLIEETRILSDTFGAKGRLQMVFAGQPELHAKLKLPEMRQVDQRICGYHRLASMSRDAVAGYIQHRLLAAGGSPDRVLFPSAIVDGLHRRTGGVPRLINRVCDRALHLAFERKAETVDKEILDTALIEIGSTTLSPTWDSIIFAESTASVPVAAAAPTPVVVAAPAPTKAAPAAPPAQAARVVETAPPLDADESFKNEIDNWVSQDLVVSAPRRGVTSPEALFADEVPAKRQPQRRPAPGAPKRQAAVRTVNADWSRDLRSETYIQKLRRIWAKRVWIALAAFVMLSVVIAGASFALDTLTPPVLPETPEAPALAVPGIAPTANAPIESDAVASDSIAPTTITDSGEFLVAVGMFSSRDRADQVVEALTQAGLPAMERPVQLRVQQVQQIVIGPFFSRSDAVAALRRLQALGGYDDARVIDTRDPSVQ